MSYGAYAPGGDDYQILLLHIDGPRRLAIKSTLKRGFDDLVERGLLSCDVNANGERRTFMSDAGRHRLCQMLAASADILTYHVQQRALKDAENP